MNRLKRVGLEDRNMGIVVGLENGYSISGTGSGKMDWKALENEVSMVAMHASKNRKECMEVKWKDE